MQADKASDFSVVASWAVPAVEHTLQHASEQDEGKRGSGYECRPAMCNSAVLQLKLK
jgi:hypothetical protein